MYGIEPRRMARRVLIGNVAVGRAAPIAVQSMTNTDTADAEATARQVAELARAVRAMTLRDLSSEFLRTLKRTGFSDAELAALLEVSEQSVRDRRDEDHLDSRLHVEQ